MFFLDFQAHFELPKVLDSWDKVLIRINMASMGAYQKRDGSQNPLMLLNFMWRGKK